MRIEKLLTVTDDCLREELWCFYHTLFVPLNERTPLAQTLDRQVFELWLASPQATKLIVRNGQNAVAGLAVVSGDLRHDPLISRSFFEKHYPGRPVYHFPAIALSEELRSEPCVCRELMRAMMDGLPENGVALFFHSEVARAAMPRLVRRACFPKVAVKKSDAMACVLCTWRDMTNHSTNESTALGR